MRPRDPSPWFAVLAFSVAPNVSSGAALPETTPYDPHELARMPIYCKHTPTYREHVPGGNDPQQIAHWDRLLGPARNPNVTMFTNMHHYCNGLFKTNKALLTSQTPEWRRFYLTSAIEEFDYVIRTAPDNFVLLPEILTKRGENLIRLGDAKDAEATLNRAIELKRDYWPPYAALADLYKQQGDIAKTRDVLKKGLAVAPNTQALTRRLSELASAAPKSR